MLKTLCPEKADASHLFFVGHDHLRVVTLFNFYRFVFGEVFFGHDDLFWTFIRLVAH